MRLMIVGPLKGKDSTGPKNWSDTSVRLLRFPIPKDPLKDKWEGQVVTDELHVMHNFLPVAWDHNQGDEILTASYEGVSVLGRSPDGKWSRTQLGAGDQKNAAASHGSSEVKVGHWKGPPGARFIATIEPFHGNQVVVYTQPAATKAGDGKGDEKGGEKAGEAPPLCSSFSSGWSVVISGPASTAPSIPSAWPMDSL